MNIIRTIRQKWADMTVNKKNKAAINQMIDDCERALDMI
jgi:hypothetical protein